MTERQKKFVDEYLVTGNASEAARRAGYSKRTAGSQGERMLKNVEIRAKVDARLKEMESERTLTLQESLEHLAAVVRGQVTEVVTTASGKKVKVPVREADKLRALDMYFKIQGAYREQVEVKLSGAEAFKQTLEKIWNE